MSTTDRTTCIAQDRGTAVGYRYHRCRCADCTEAHRLHNKRLREHRQPPWLLSPIGTQRRIQALMALGWTGGEIARRAGWDSRRRVNQLLARRQIRPETAKRIAGIYSELAGTPGPSPVGRARSRAAGYMPPQAWNDIDNDPSSPATSENMDGPVDAGTTSYEIAQLLHSDPRAVHRDRNPLDNRRAGNRRGNAS